jgi:O-antigen ligase
MTRPQPSSPTGFARTLPWLDRLTEGLLYLMVIFAPWAFGTTQPWSIRCMNVSGYALGGLLVLKILLRSAESAGRAGTSKSSRSGLKPALYAVTLALLGYVLVAAVNAEFTYVASEWRQEPHPHVAWLPHSLDRNATWQVFWNWLALACVLWAVHDWLTSDIAPEGHRRARRFRRLLFVLAANAAFVALEGILQRNSGTALLLWFMPTRENATATAQFGPYAYRANAAQFFNLIWPVALAVWWQQTQRQRRTQAHHWLLPCIMLLIAGSLVSLSRGGVAVTVLQLCACGVVVLARGKFRGAGRAGFFLVVAATLAAAAYLGWDELAHRLRDTAADPLSGRSETYRLAARMTADYPWFGVGPGAFGSAFQFYRNSPADYWPGQLHNDWLEFLITFGRIGCALLLVAGSLVVGRWYVPDGVRAPWTVVAFVWIALGGCLLHARFDFPLQIYSIQFVFILLCAVLFAMSREAKTSATP